MSKFGLGEGTESLAECIKRAQIHVLHHNRYVPGRFLVDSKALDNIRRVGPAEDFHLPEELAAHERITISVDDFEGVDLRSSLVAYFVDCTTIAVAKNLYPLEFVAREAGRSFGGGGGGGGGGRKRQGEAGAAFRELRQRESEIELTALADYGHVMEERLG